MRRITEHRIEHGGFDEAVRNLTRNAPWWLTSAAAHGVEHLDGDGEELLRELR